MPAKFLTRATLLLSLLAIAACGGGARASATGAGAVAPAAAVERFLSHVAEPDYMEMGWVFGTDRGPIMQRDPAGEVERRMYAIANVLRHESYVIRSQAPVPGRVGRAIQVDVAVRQRGRDYVVPFTVVQGPGQRWFVEQIRLEAITGQP